MRTEVLQKLKFLKGTQLVWRRPPTADIAILDEVGAQELVEYFSEYSSHIIDLSGMTINVRALFRAILRGRTNLLGYAIAYLELVQPKIAITLIDTTPFFYRLKNYIPNLTTIAIQNGWRSYESKRDFAREGSPLCVDHLLCFGEVSRSLYTQAISGTFHIIGSFRSNKVPVSLDPHATKIALISTLRSKVDLNEKVTGYDGFPTVTYSEIFERRLELAKYVAEFCRESSLSLLILGKEPDDVRERDFYTSLLKNFEIDWEFRPRTDLLSNYLHLNEARIAISTSSSLGYEALGRGIRTAFFMLDPEVTGNFGDRFGWPEPLEDSGEIWTNSLDKQKTLEILNFLHVLDDSKWEQLRGKYVPRMISSDPGNTVLKELIRRSVDNK